MNVGIDNNQPCEKETALVDVLASKGAVGIAVVDLVDDFFIPSLIRIPPTPQFVSIERILQSIVATKNTYNANKVLSTNWTNSLLVIVGHDYSSNPLFRPFAY